MLKCLGLGRQFLREEGSARKILETNCHHFSVAIDVDLAEELEAVGRRSRDQASPGR